MTNLGGKIDLQVLLLTHAGSRKGKIKESGGQSEGEGESEGEGGREREGGREGGRERESE